VGVAPRVASACTYAVLAWGVMVSMLGGFVTLDRWVLDTSIFRHIAAAPAVAPDWRACAGLAVVGLVTAAAGVLLFARRDLSAS
jgi:ABC-2 type transport system permease protein